MKNILAENLLRFGTKNLSESDRLKLEQATKTPTPAAKIPPVTAFFNSYYPNTKKTTPIQVTGQLAKNPQTGGISAGQITFYIQGRGKSTLVRFVPDSNGVYRVSEPADVAQLGSLLINGDQIAKGNKPLTAINQVLANLSKQSGMTLSLDPKIKQAFDQAYAGYTYTANRSQQRIDQNNTRLMPQSLQDFGIASIQIYKDPETDQELTKEMTVGAENFRFRRDGNKIVSAYPGELERFRKAVLAKTNNEQMASEPFVKKALMQLYTTLEQQPVI